MNKATRKMLMRRVTDLWPRRVLAKYVAAPSLLHRPFNIVVSIPSLHG